MSKKNYFSSYKSPNIRIVPSASICYPPSPKRPKLETPARDNSPQNVDVSFLDDFDVDEIVKCLNDCDDNTQNTAKQKNMEMNNDTLEKGCPQNSIKIINSNEQNELKYNTEGGSLTKSRDNEEIDIGIENTHKNMNTNMTFNEIEVKVSATYYHENKHADVHIHEEDPKIFVPSPITKQPNDATYSAPYNINKTELITRCLENETDNNNIIELINKESIKTFLLPTEEDLVSTNKTSKPFNGDGKTEHKIGTNTIMKNVDNITCCEETCLQYSDDSELQNKCNATFILEVERTIDKFNTNEIIDNKQFHNTPEVSKPFESENLKNINSLQTINKNENRFKAKVTNNNQIVLCENVDKPEPDVLVTYNNLEKQMLQCLHKKYSNFSFIHSGKFSKIFKCIDSEGKNYAVKMIKIKGNGYRKESLWSRIQSDIPKENLLCVYLIAGFSLNRNWCYLTDFYPKNLQDVLKESKKNLHIDTIQELAGQLIGAVTTLRNKNIVHSDINPYHILLDYTNSKLKLCGFDEAYYIETANLFPYKGTKCYRAPEVILGYSAGFSLDVWSTALVLHEMATGIKIFGGCIADHVLYKQMCILGDVPPQMLLKSHYRNKYIIGYCLQNDRCSTHIDNYMVKGKNKIACTIQGAYYAHWTVGKNQKQISKDMQKIRQFTKLVEQMLVIYPEHRLPIEFAYSNPFIYKVFNN